MKRILALLLIFAALASFFAGCAENTGNSTEPAQKNTEPPSPTEQTEQLQQTDSIEPTAGIWDGFECITVAQALELCDQYVDGPSEAWYYVRATVDSIDDPTYGQMTVSDETGTIMVYGSYSSDGSVRYDAMTQKPVAGDEVLLYGCLQNYKGTTKEFQKAYIIDFIAAQIVPPDPDGYTTMSIAEARNATEGTCVGVSGVVARITYANGNIPCGFILVDETGSIYIYDGALAGRVAVGDAITLAASKTWWILSAEQGNASKFGYRGCCQLENPALISIDGEGQSFPTEWIEETTVKAIMDTPVSQDITTCIYKVTACITKVVGTGFTNYYINDLDGVTGSYVYSQCDGEDFSWLDEFDGNICTVYLMALNAKSTASECFWRFLPVAVCDENFDASTVNVAEHVVEYYGLPQFLCEYSGDPSLELITTVDSQLLGFTGASLSYESSDPEVITIENNTMHCVAPGTATITVTGSFDGTACSKEITVTVTANEETDSITVSEAIETASGETVAVRGIVGPSLVNQSGFYLIDDSGIIAVLMDSAQLEALSIGDEVVLEGLRYTKCEDSFYYGQTLIKDAVVLANYYGDHAYCDSTFIHGTSLSDFYNLDVMTDYSTTVFVVDAIVDYVETSYYTTIQLTDGNGTTVSLYCSGAGQYSWLKEFADQQVTVELAACNWNGKNYWRGCVLSVILEDGSKVVNSLNFQ